MTIHRLSPPPLLALLGACAGHITDNGMPDPLAVSVPTQHNDNTRAGLNDHETILKPSNVSVSTFGAVFSLLVDDQVHAQPLVVANLPIAHSSPPPPPAPPTLPPPPTYHNVVSVAPANNSVCASGGDDGRLYWHRNYS